MYKRLWDDPCAMRRFGASHNPSLLSEWLVPRLCSLSDRQAPYPRSAYSLRCCTFPAAMPTESEERRSGARQRTEMLKWVFGEWVLHTEQACEGHLVAFLVKSGEGGEGGLVIKVRHLR